MRVLIVGLGAIGRRHLTNLVALEPKIDITVWRHALNHKDDPSTSLLANSVVYTLEDAIRTRPDCALITCPTSRHIEIALALANEGIHLFIEKPLSNSMVGVDELLAICHQRKVALMVGYCFRFYQPLQAMRKAITEDKIGRVLSVYAEAGQYLPEWRPDSDYRQSVSARRELGGGVLLELSHEFDYLRWLVGEVCSVSARAAKLSDLDIDVEDTAEVTLEFLSGSLGSIHLNMTQQPASRTCRIVGTQGSLKWDYRDHSVRLFSTTSEIWSDLYAPHSLDRNEMYLVELKHFLECVRERKKPIVNGEDGKRTLEIVLAAKESVDTGRLIELCSPTLLA